MGIDPQGGECLAMGSADRYVEAMGDISRSIAEGCDQKDVLDLVARCASAALASDATTVRLLDPTGAWLHLMASHGLPPTLGTAPVKTKGAGAPPAVTTVDLRTAADQFSRPFARAGFATLVRFPLLARGEVIGALTLLFRAPRVLVPAEQAAGTSFAALAAVAIAQGRLSESLAFRIDELAALHGIGRDLTTARSLDTVLEQIVERTVRAMGVARCALFVDDGSGSLVPRASLGLVAWQAHVSLRAGQGIPGLAVAERRPVSCVDIRTANGPAYEAIVTPEGTSAREFCLRQGYVALLAVPIISGDRVLGAICLYWDDVHHHRQREIDGLTALADYAAIALEAGKAFEETETQLRRMETLLSVIQTASASLDLAETMRVVACETGRALGAGMVGAYLADAEDSVLRPVAGYHVPPHLRELFLKHPIPIGGHRFVEEGRASQRAVFSADADADARIDRETIRRFHHRSVLFVPMIAKGRTIGSLFVVWWEPKERLNDEEVRLVEAIGRHAGMTVENARLYQAAVDAREEIEMLTGIGRDLTQSLSLDQVLGMILQQILFLAESDAGYVALVEASGIARSVASQGKGNEKFIDLVIRPGVGIAGLALSTGAMQESTDCASGVADSAAGRADGSIRSVLAMPITLASRKVGLLVLGRHAPGPFDKDTKRRLQALHLWLAIALENARLYRDLGGAKAEVEAANVALTRSLRVQSEFLANTSHELRTPLSTIIGLLNGVTEGICRDEEEERSFLAESAHAAQKLLVLINDILDMARIEAGKLDLSLQSVEVGPVVAEVGRLFLPECEAKGVVLRWEEAAQTPAAVMADEHRLRQVLVNVVGNSVKFTEEGSITLRAESTPDRGVMTIEVADTGIGVGPADRARLFQRFTQSDGSNRRRHGGTGLGLAISKHLVEMMGGTIVLESEGTDRGTRVLISLPLAVDGLDRSMQSGDIFEGPGASPLALIVGDDSDLTDPIDDVLHGEGFQTAVATTADEAFQRALALGPVAVVVDLALPSGASARLRTGIDLIAALSSADGLRSRLAVLITDAPREADLLVRNLGACMPVRIVEKPLSPARLRKAITASLATLPRSMAHHAR